MLLQSIFNFLEQDIFKNIVLLKMLHNYGEQIEKHFLQTADGTAVLLLLPTHAFYYDALTYPQAKYVVLFSTDNLAATASIFQQIPQQCNLIFKLMDEAAKTKLATIFPWRRVTAFLSYTSRAEQKFAADPEVRISTSVDEASLAVYEAQGHPSATVHKQFAQGEAINFVMHQNGRLASLCFTYRNYGPVWEIGGVWTDPDCRRNGYAHRVVATALHTLTHTQRAPRYQVHESNHSSIQLAESLGLVRFATLEHFLVEIT